MGLVNNFYFISDMLAKAAALPQHRNDLNVCIKKLRQWQQDLEHREQAASQQEQKLNVLKKQLETQQLQLTAETERLNSQKTALEEAADRYHQERQELEKLIPVQKTPTLRMEDEMNSIRGQLLQIKDALRNSQTAFIQLNTTIQSSYYESIKKLCHLYRNLSLSEQEEAHLYAAQLAAILQCEFNAEPLDPQPNDTYDNNIHEHIDTAHMGDRILCCRARGWKWNGAVLMHALVETTERNEYE